MAFTVQQKVQCCYWLAEFKYPKIVERRFRQQWPEKQPPDRHTITTWHRKLLETGSVVEKSPRGKKVREAQVDRIQQAFQRSPTKSVRRASRELGIPKSTVHDVLHKRLRLRAYKIQLVQKLQPNDLPARYDFASNMLLKIDNDNGYLQKVVFSDESTFHINGIVNRHNCRIWGSENPRVVREMERGTPKINVWCGLTYETVIGPFFFVEKTINANVYLDMLQNYAIPQIPQGYVFQQDGAPPHFAFHVREHLNECFPQRWIGRAGPTAWPPRSPDLTPLDFFFWGYIKNIVYKTPVVDLDDLRRRIIAACATVTPEMLQNTWQELEYRLDICRATRGAHIEIY